MLAVAALVLGFFASVQGFGDDPDPRAQDTAGDGSRPGAEESGGIDGGDGSEVSATDETTEEPTSGVQPRRLAAQQVRAAQQARESAIAARDRAQAAARRQARREARAAAREEARLERIAASPLQLTVASFNVLGSQHTGPGGPRSNYPAASVRTPAAAGLMAAHGVDVIGTQELQADQLRGVQARTGMAAYPGFAWGEAETDNSVLWDPSRFELVSGDRFTITFMGRPRPQPIVRLRALDSGREFYVVNTHPSAGGGRYATERARAHATLVGIVNGLEATGLPVLLTGDMNDREAFFCRVVAGAGLVASNGGSYGSGCSPPPGAIPVDWVVGSPDVSFSNYRRDTSSTARRISDHIFISAAATLS